MPKLNYDQIINDLQDQFLKKDTPNVQIGDNVKIQAQAGVTSDVESNTRITGTPAISYMNYNKSYIHFKNLPEIVKKIDKKD